MKNYTVHYSVATIICLLFFVASSFAQTTTTPPAQPALPASPIVQFPIGTTNTTDPNYETNLAKYKDLKEFVPPAPDNTIKDEAYYLKEIESMKKEIAEKEQMTDKTSDVLDKIEYLKLQLSFLQNYYKQLIQK
ncbi:MAG: hypothetical protein JWP12_2106 [Bacteroidetes bacterium]|nr:hypothetical protein [Bacteroidota bacterium]